MRKAISPLIIGITLFLSCKGDPEPEKEAIAPEHKVIAQNGMEALISNGIELEAKGVKISRAFLLYDNSTLVPPGNKTIEGRPVKLRLVVEEGWKEIEGKVALGASETIQTDKGQLVLHEPDLFAKDLIFDTAAAKAITLTATISKLGRKQNHFIVSFRIWDKNGTGEVKGHYKLYVQ